MDEDLDDLSSTQGKPLKSIKNTLTYSHNGGPKSNLDETTNDTQQNIPIRRILNPNSDHTEQVDSLLHNPLDNINSLCKLRKIGMPSSLAVLGNQILAIGTTLANLIVFDIGED